MPAPILRWITDLRSALTAFFIAAPLCFLGARYPAKAFPSQSEFIRFLGFPIEIPVFLIGIVGYFVWREWIKGRRDRTLSSVLLTATVLLYLSFIPFDYGTLYGTSFTALLLLSLSLYPWPALVNSPTRFLGRVSYSIYLIHFVIIQRVQGWIDLHDLSWHPATRFAACLAATLLLTTLLAYCSWRWVEEPGKRLGRVLTARLESKVLRPA